MLTYIEYISRRPGVSLEAFHKVLGLGQGGWAEDHADDVPVLLLGRTWRIGPEPEYMCVWHTKDHGLERIDEWERVFRAGEADAYEEPFRLAARIDHAGCYDALIEPVRSDSERFFAEFFDTGDGAGPEDVRAAYEQRADRDDGVELVLLLDRIGHLGPAPRGLAVWALPRWASLEGIARELDADGGPVRSVTAALYSQVGKETL
jgi:hypothetical protein